MVTKSFVFTTSIFHFVLLNAEVVGLDKQERSYKSITYTCLQSQPVQSDMCVCGHVCVWGGGCSKS